MHRYGRGGRGALIGGWRGGKLCWGDVGLVTCWPVNLSPPLVGENRRVHPRHRRDARVSMVLLTMAMHDSEYTPPLPTLSKDCSWDAHIAKQIGKGKARVGKMDAILTDSHLDTRIKRCILINVIVPKLEYAGEVWEGNAKFVKELETKLMTAAKNMLGCSSTTSNTVLRAELGIYPLKSDTRRDVSS